MKTLKLFIFAAISFAACSIARAQVPTYAPNTAFSGYMFDVGTTNLATPIVIDVRKQGNVRFMALIKGPTTATNVYFFGPSVDGVTYSTNAPDTLIWSADTVSTLQTARTTNSATGGTGYLVLFQVNCTQKNTNSLSYGTKISAP